MEAQKIREKNDSKLFGVVVVSTVEAVRATDLLSRIKKMQCVYHFTKSTRTEKFIRCTFSLTHMPEDYVWRCANSPGETNLY